MDEKQLMPAPKDDGTERGQKILDQLVEERMGKKLATQRRKKKTAGKAGLYDEDGKRKSQSTVLVDLCAEIELFHDADSTCYAVIERGAHREVWQIHSKSFRNWLSHEYFVLTGQGARSSSVADALATVEARAQYKSEQREVFQRVAWLGDKIIIDLADEAWRVVEVDAAGWRILEQSQVMFTRRSGMAPLPPPMPGNLSDLAHYINVEPGDMPLIVGWLLMAARGRGPYPVLILNGEQGTGKSTTTRVLRSVIDPSTVPLRGLTRDVRDLLVTATNNHVVVSDNLSSLSAELSDVFCRLSTGGGFAERQLYTNREEVLVNLQRPVILNGIDEVASRGDLMERALIIHLPLIKETSRDPESSFWKRFDAALPSILGGLCDALSCALRSQHSVVLARKPRMADFAMWVTAAEPALGWKPGTFMESYTVNLDAGVEVALEASPFGEALLKFITAPECTTWTGTASDLLNELEGKAHERALKSQTWPKSPKGAASALRRLAPLFRRMGIVIEQTQREAGTGRRMVMIHSSGFPASQSSHRHKSNNGADSSHDVCKDESSQQPSPCHGNSHTVKPVVALSNSSGVACDDCDAKNWRRPTSYADIK